MHLSSWQAWSWLAGFIGYTVLMAVLVVRKRYRTFPWFTFLLALEIVQSIVLFEAHRYAKPRAYFYTYWCFEVLDSLVRVGVFFELARITSRLLRENGSERMRALMIAVVIASAICVGVVIGGPGVGHVLVTSALKVSVCTSILGGVLVFFFLVTTFLEGIRSRVHSQALAYGLFLYFSGRLLAQLGLLYGGKWTWFKWESYTGSLYIVCLFAWSVILWFDEPERVLSEEMDRLHRTFEVIEQKQSHLVVQDQVPATMTDVLSR
jgi:hypothetical protein